MDKEPIEFRAGGIVFRWNNNELEYLLVTSNSNRERWIIPAGHIEPGETPEQTALREVMEEAGVETEVVEDLGSFQYYWYRSRQRVLIDTHLFLMHYSKTVIEKPEGRDVAFFTFEEILQKNLWEETRQFFLKAHQIAEQFIVKSKPNA